MLHLWAMEQVLWSRKSGADDFEASVERLRKELGDTPRLDILPELYRPNLIHTARLHDEDEYRTYRIEICGVVVRYVEDSYSIQATVEGALPVETVAQLRSDITAKLEALE